MKISQCNSECAEVVCSKLIKKAIIKMVFFMGNPFVGKIYEIIMLHKWMKRID